MTNHIAELRQAKNLTLKVLAEKLGVSEGYVSQLQGKKALPAAHRTKLAAIFGVPADKVVPLDAKGIVRRRRIRALVVGRAKGGRALGLLGAIAAAEAAVIEVGKSIGPQERELFGLLATLSPANRDMLLTVARSFASKG